MGSLRVSRRGCVHRHLITTIVAQLFCARVRETFTKAEDVVAAARLTLEQVRRAADVYIAAIDLPRQAKYNRYQAELDRMQYHQKRNAIASRCHRKRRYLL